MNGWLSYSPLMLLSVLGFFFLYRLKNKNTSLFLLLVAIHIYIIYSWWNWYYINGFGSRPMVDLYALLAFPLAASLSFLLKKGKNYLLYAVVGLFIGLNIFQVYQHNLGIMWTEMANWAYYQQAFGKTTFDQKMSVALDVGEYQDDDLILVNNIYTENFENQSFTHANTAIKHEGDYSYQITRESSTDFGDTRIPYEAFLNHKKELPKYLKIEFWVYVQRQGGGFYDFDTMILDFEKEDQSVYRRRYLRLNNKTGEQGDFSIWWGVPQKWTFVEASIKIPTDFQEAHQFRLSFNKETEGCEVYVDDIQVFTAN